MKIKLKITTAKLYVKYVDGTDSLDDTELLGKYTNKDIEQAFISENNAEEKPIEKVSLVCKDVKDVIYQIDNYGAFYMALKNFASTIDTADNESKGE